MAKKVVTLAFAWLLLAFVGLGWAQACPEVVVPGRGEAPALTSCLYLQVPRSPQIHVPVELPLPGSFAAVTASTDSPARIELCLLDALHYRLMCRAGEGAASLEDLSPPAGEYLLRVLHDADGALPVRLELAKTPRHGDELEPNDDLPQATPLKPAAGFVPIGDHRSGAAGAPADGRAPASSPPLEARGRTVGDEHDYFRLEVEGDPQLWRLEVEGSHLEMLSYFDGSGRQVQRRFAEPQGGAISMTNLFLLPGRHYVSIRGEDGEYLLRAVPLGPPAEGGEREANDDETRAEALGFDEPRQGVLDPGDEDYYRFTLYATERVRLELEPDTDLSLRFYLDDRYSTSHDAAPGEKLTYEAMLLPGDHYVRVAGNSGSVGGYGMRLVPLDPLAGPVDLEPNDVDHQARPLPPSLVTRGTLGRDDSHDWYLLPALDEAVTAKVTGEGDVSLTFYRLDDQARQQVAYLRELGEDGLVELPAGRDLRMVVKGSGDYRLELDLGRDTSAPEDGLRIALDADMTTAAAYWHEGQRIPAEVMVENDSPDERLVELVAVSSHYGWRPRLEQEPLRLAPFESRRIPLTVEVLPDARDDLEVRVTVQARNGARANLRLATTGPTASAAFDARCGASPVSPALLWSLPDSLLGGLNVAWSGLGGEIVNSRENYAATYAIDGMVAPSRGWTGLLGHQATIRLARSDARLVGVALNPYATRTAAEWLADFELLASVDGETFEPVLRGRLGPEPVEQAFLFERPITASHLRIVTLSSQAGDRRGFALGELKVIAEPDADLFASAGADLAHQPAGGYLVWSRPFFDFGPTFLQDAGEAQLARLPEGVTTLEWAVGFHNNRAARLATLEWVAQPAAGERDRELTSVEVSVSLESPIGPWQPIATWDVDDKQVLELPELPWARFVRFRAEGLEEKENYQLPIGLRIREASVSGDYRSILGEWGQSGRQAIFELLEPRAESRALAEQDGNDSRERAQPLLPGKPVEGRVVVGEDVDWYQITVPEGENFLRFEIHAEPLLAARFELLAANGQPVLHDVGGTPSRVELTAFVEPGDYFLRLDEPPRSVVFAWDNSGSMGDYLDIIYQTVSGFVTEVQPGREVAQLLAFEEDPRGVFLLPDWSDDALELMAALNEYDRRAGSSNAEANLLASTRALGEREGTRAILFMTDAESNGARLNAELWSELERVRPRVFTFETSSAGSAHTQDLMQSWADVSGGHYDYARGVGDFEAGFARATCHLRRPAHYRLELGSEYRQPPGPGLLGVARGDGVAGNPPVEIILDLSGSMAKALPSGPSRVEVAKRVLTTVVDEMLPAGTPFALRMYGHLRPNSCDTRLEHPLGPLDPERVRSMVAAAQPQLLSGTPLAASLAEVPGDLAGGGTGATVILLTDGEESCGGDVEAEVARLGDSGTRVRLHIISFDIESPEAKAQFERWAGLGGGSFFDANDEEGLALALRSALAPGFDVLDQGGKVVASGVVGGGHVPVPPGIYDVRIAGAEEELFEDVRVRGDDEQLLLLHKGGG